MDENEESKDMNNLSAMIEGMLSDPDTQSKIGSLVSSLTKSDDNADNGNLTDMFSGVGIGDIQRIMKFKSLYDDAMKKSDPRVTLLTALRPYLSEEKHKSLDTAIKILTLSKLSSVIKQTDLLKELL